MSASVMEIDFSVINEQTSPMPRRPLKRKSNQKPLVNSKKQLRARARRSRNGGKAELAVLHKPIEEWDPEELAMGRPRDVKGNFGGRPPTWISRELHEEAMTRFRQFVKDGMNSHTTLALKTIGEMLENNDLDDKGRPIVPASTKVDVAKWLVEQVVGKPKQKIEGDISVKLQGLLASVIITPGQLPAMPNAKALTSPRSKADALDVDGWEDDED